MRNKIKYINSRCKNYECNNIVSKSEISQIYNYECSECLITNTPLTPDTNYSDLQTKKY